MSWSSLGDPYGHQNNSTKMYNLEKDDTFPAWINCKLGGWGAGPCSVLCWLSCVHVGTCYFSSLICYVVTHCIHAHMAPHNGLI
jgi:hypothetical protein